MQSYTKEDIEKVLIEHSDIVATSITALIVLVIIYKLFNWNKKEKIINYKRDTIEYRNSILKSRKHVTLKTRNVTSSIGLPVKEYYIELPTNIKHIIVDDDVALWMKNREEFNEYVIYTVGAPLEKDGGYLILH